MQFNKTYISFGANLANAQDRPAQTLRHACTLLDRPALQFVAASSLWETPAWPDPSEPPFANAVAMFMCAIPPARLMELLLHTEAAFGRQRTRANAPRTLDLDILDYGGMAKKTQQTHLPHPRMHARAFVLLPLQELDAHWQHPLLHKRAEELLAAIPETEKRACKIIGPMK